MNENGPKQSEQTKRERIKGPEIGLHQATRLCQLSQAARLELFSEGLPLILKSAEGFWTASRRLGDAPREARVLAGFAEEEAAKILILMDAVRCPAKLVSSRISKIVGWLYSHLARLIYAEAQHWKPIHLDQLREHVDWHRRGHYIDGYAGEYIMPNHAVYQRESTLYADIEAFQDGTLRWTAPHETRPEMHFSSDWKPLPLRLAEAMHQLGMFTAQGLRATSEIWGSLEFQQSENNHDAARLMNQLLVRLIEEKLPLPTAEQDHANLINRDWQIPMYNLDLSLVSVSLEELEAAQERELWNEIGDPY